MRVQAHKRHVDGLRKEVENDFAKNNEDGRSDYSRRKLFGSALSSIFYCSLSHQICFRETSSSNITAISY